MDSPLSNTVGLVTGASSGIGEATARALARQGAGVAVIARRRDRLEALAGDLEGEGANVLVVEADIADKQQAQAAVERTVGGFGRLDIVVNNAGLMLTGAVSDAPLEEWERMLDVNVEGMLYVTQAALPHLVQAANEPPRRVADVVMISSTAGRVARPGAAVYSLTKFGTNAFSESLRQELQPQRVRVGLIEPGTVGTELTTHLRDGVREAVAQQVQGMQMLRPDDIAEAVVYMVTRDRRVAVNEMLVRAGDQTW